MIRPAGAASGAAGPPQLAHPVPYRPRHWAIAPRYDGLIDTSLATGDPKDLAAVVRAGRRARWQPGAQTYHADDHAAGHAWMRLYLMQRERNPALLEPFKARFDEILAKPIREPLSLAEPPRTPGVEPTDRWTWADALYMAPPTLALLARATGDERYLEFVVRPGGLPPARRREPVQGFGGQAPLSLAVRRERRGRPRRAGPASPAWAPFGPACPGRFPIG